MQLKADAISVIKEVLNVNVDEITNIATLKTGMTNRSFQFTCRDKKYIMRIPGEGTTQLINRNQEAKVFQTICGKGICDDPLYINPENGFKIATFLDGIRCCDPRNVNDLKRCMTLLKNFHNMKLKVEHTFDIFGQIEFYESLWGETPSMYKDYAKTKENLFALKPYIEKHACESVLAHIDAVPDNFLFFDRGNGEELQLTDWEYAGMQDPHVDIAMFCIYAMYNKKEVDRLISIYFDEGCSAETKIKIYCYIAACGLLWRNWCEYKRLFGVEFGEYSLQQYQYAKEYYKIAMMEM